MIDEERRKEQERRKESTEKEQGRESFRHSSENGRKWNFPSLTQQD